MEYQHSPHNVHLINYHIVFCPKYRGKVLVGAKHGRLEEILHQVATEHGWSVLALEAMPDHVHLFVSVDTKTKPETVVQLFKGRSSHDLRKEFPELLQLPSLWTRSCFISSAGNVSSEVIQRYIENQWGKKF